ncbi:carbohydrate ABC transporter permease [uncultured Chloroflexus sp.]|uniref:carbohydrate ABC transporter permease n=1 Tax=uncultured Chloroflexus sp. TaxID=214040 RepID=UPI00262C3B0F|nr:carbohydrate ABC transporter permease [uncultured Chloroflexus sp.]
MTSATLAAPRRHRRFRFGRVMVYVVMIAITLLWITPTIGLLVSSFRPADDVKTSGWWTVVTNPERARFTLDNYRVVLGIPIPDRPAPGGGTRVGMEVALINTLTVALPATIIPILIAAFAAYGFAWIDFPGRRPLFILVVAMLVVPLQISLVPILRDYVALRLGGTYLGVWLAHTGFGLPLAVYLLYNYISTIPRDIFESAFLDGATHFTIFTRLILPLSMPALASFAIFQFLWTWNDLLVALVFLGAEPRVQVVTQRLLSLLGQFGQEWHLLTAGAFISMIVPLIVFFSLQRFFVRGLMAGSVKG